MASFRGRDDSGRTIEDLTPETLRVLLEEAEEFVIVENRSWGDESYCQAMRLDEGAWRVEVRSGSAERHVGTTAGNLDAVFDIVRSWAAADGWWQEAFTWERVVL